MGPLIENDCICVVNEVRTLLGTKWVESVIHGGY
jgi:hypothetical protein